MSRESDLADIFRAMEDRGPEFVDYIVRKSKKYGIKTTHKEVVDNIRKGASK